MLQPPHWLWNDESIIVYPAAFNPELSKASYAATTVVGLKVYNGYEESLDSVFVIQSLSIDAFRVSVWLTTSWITYH